jgi:hypothetical protein
MPLYLPHRARGDHRILLSHRHGGRTGSCHAAVAEDYDWATGAGEDGKLTSFRTPGGSCARKIRDRALTASGSGFEGFMLSVCANPDCHAAFDYQQGRLFRFHKDHPAGEKPPNTHSVQHFWLCRRLPRRLYPRVSGWMRSPNQEPRRDIVQARNLSLYCGCLSDPLHCVPGSAGFAYT